MEAKDILTLIGLVALIAISSYSAFMPREPAIITTTDKEIVYVNQTEIVEVPVTELVYIQEACVDSFNMSYCRVTNTVFNGTTTTLVKGTCTPDEIAGLISLMTNSTPLNMSDMTVTIAK
ncbi:MAG: hypothetical protein WC307_06195 [Candidatus Nanoarchaeia archaeon]|jgi:hypothetical protein